MTEGLDSLARFYRYLLVEYSGYYRVPKEKDSVFWRNLDKFCRENELNPFILMIAHFEHHKKYYNSTPYPNMLYTKESLNRYHNYIEELLRKYPSGEIPLAIISRTLAIVQEVEADCYKIKMIAKELNLSKYDAALSIFLELSPYTKLTEPKLTPWLKLFKDADLKLYHPYQRELLKNQGLRSLLKEVLERELYGRKLSFRLEYAEQNLSSVSQRG